MEKLIVKTTDKKGRVKEKVFTEKQAVRALAFMCKELARGCIIEKKIEKFEENICE